jgi:endonuclease YncB( thermonuclease family)
MAIMARTASPRKILWGILLLLIFVGLRYFRDNQKDFPSTTSKAPLEKVESHTTQTNGWTIHRNCTLVSHPHNDGDSFRVKLPDGSERDFRLYFVDTPESQFKRYRDGNTNAKRIAEQARYFNNLSSERAVEVGKRAKDFTLELLVLTHFDVITKNEAVYDSERYYAHIELNYQAQRQRLDELLVKQGFARIYTKGEELADGTSMEQHRDRLRKIEGEAKQQKLGAWK